MSSNHDREQPGAAGEDAAVSRAWRQASGEQPPARLDAVILAAAGEKVLPVRPRARSRWMQWQPLAAAATVAGLAFALVQTLPRDREVAPPVRMEAPASAPAPAMAPEAVPETQSRAPARADTESSSSGAARVVPHRSAESAARSHAAEAAADVADTMRDAAAAPTAARAVGALAVPSAEDWATRIEALHATGDLAGAAEVLREFRAADPHADAHLPEPLRDWALAVE